MKNKTEEELDEDVRMETENIKVTNTLIIFSLNPVTSHPQMWGEVSRKQHILPGAIAIK